MNWEDFQLMPALIPIHQTKRQVMEYNEIEDSFGNKNLNKKKTEIKEEKKNVEKNMKPMIDSQIIDQISNKFKSVHDQGTKRYNTQKNTDNEKMVQHFNSKMLITDIMHKIQAKNISEELNPITTQRIKDLIIKTNDDLMLLQEEAERKEAVLLINSNNQHLKKEIRDIKDSIDRCNTIKELYHEKINFRNKIFVLQANLIDLKDQNRNLQISISKGISDAENHKYHLPCEKQKILSEKLKTCEEELIKQKRISEKISKNISEIMKNFNKLYQEAEIARLIVAQKLRQLQTKEKNLVDASSNNQKSITLEKKSPQQQALIERNLKGSTNIKKSNASNSQAFQTRKNNNQNYKYLQPTNQLSQQNVKTKGKTYSLEEQMRSMLSNQINVSKYIKY